MASCFALERPSRFLMKRIFCTPLCIVTIAILVCVGRLAAQAPQVLDAILPQARIAPADEAYRDPTLVEMRKRLMVVLSKCNRRAILAMADQNVTLDGWKDFDGGFRELLDGTKREPHLCSEMYDSLSLGGLLRAPDRFESNYAVLLFTGETDREVPNGTYQVITEAHVPVLGRIPVRTAGGRATSKARVIAELSYDVVLAKPIPPGTWKRVEYAKGHFGFVQGKKLADPGGLVVKLQRGPAGWKIKELYEYYE
jgi:hypothetical protein